MVGLAHKKRGNLGALPLPRTGWGRQAFSGGVGDRGKANGADHCAGRANKLAVLIAQLNLVGIPTDDGEALAFIQAYCYLNLIPNLGMCAVV